MTTKRGEGVAKRRELSQRLRRIATGLRIEGAINMAGTLVQAAEVIEASSPSALIAAVEAMSGFSVSHFPDGSIVTDKEGEYVDREDVLKLLRAAPTEAVEDATK